MLVYIFNMGHLNSGHCRQVVTTQIGNRIFFRSLNDTNVTTVNGALLTTINRSDIGRGSLDFGMSVVIPDIRCNFYHR